MSLFDRVKDNLVGSRLEEEAYYQAALQEIESGGRRPGIWAKALSRSKGNQDAAKALYVRLLVAKLKDEAHISKRAQEANLRQAEAKEEEAREKYRRARLKEEENKRAELYRTKSERADKAGSIAGPITWAALLIGLVTLIAYYANTDLSSPASSRNYESEIEASNYSFTQLKANTNARSEYNKTVIALEKRYPSLNPNSWAYDQHLVNRLVEARDRYQGRGYEANEALLQAVEDILGKPRE